MKRDDRKASTAETWIGRREFLTRAAAVGFSIPAVSAVAAAGAAARVRVRDRGRPFEGVKLTLGKAPHGDNEKELFKKWLAPFEEETGATVEHTIVPWPTESSQFLLSYSGPTPFDVSYQVTVDLTGLGTHGALEDLAPYLKRADFASEREHFHESFIRPSLYKGKLYGLPFITGTIVMFYNKRMLAEAGVSRAPRRRRSSRLRRVRQWERRVSGASGRRQPSASGAGTGISKMSTTSEVTSSHRTCGVRRSIRGPSFRRPSTRST